MRAAPLLSCHPDRPAPGTQKGRPPRREESAAARGSPLSAFIGREEELATLVALVRERRIVTVVGPGGIGKTRLVLEAEATLREAWPGGVRRVELATVRASQDLADEVAAQLGCDSLDVALLRLADQPALLVLDNCEHLLDPAARLATHLLATCPRLHVLATSRAPLAVDGEHVLVLGPLGLPRTRDGDEIAASAAARLFADRARARGVPWDASGERLEQVGELCRRLDGMPLAIELAAARARSVSVVELLAQLDRRLDVLRGRGPVGTARHASLRAAIDASYDLLAPDDQGFFRALGVFAGSFDAALAHAVAAPPEGDRIDTLDALSRLVDCSLLVAEHGARGTRYRLLESLRRYARQRACELGEDDALDERFVAAMLDLADAVVTAGLERWSSEVLATVLAEHGNLVAAVDLCLARDARGDRAFRLLLPLWAGIHQRRAADVAGACERALARWPERGTPLFAEVVAIAANASLVVGTAERAAELARLCLDLDGVTPMATVLALRTLGMAQLRRGDVVASAATFERGREAAAASGVHPFRRELAVFAAWIVSHARRDAAALAPLEALAREARDAHDEIAEAWARLARAQLLVVLGRDSEARRALDVVRDMRRGFEHPWGEHSIARLDAVLRTLEDGWPRTRDVWQRAIEHAATATDRGELSLSLKTAAVLAHRAGEVAAARALAALVPGDGKGSVLWIPFEDELAALVASEALPAPRPGAAPAADTLRRARAALARVTDPAPPALVRPEPCPAAGASLRREGSAWHVSFAGREVQVRHMKGLDDLARLLAHPDVDLHCLDLMGGAAPGGGDPDAVLDEDARRGYRLRVRELQAEIDDAQAAHDLHRAERAEAELDALVETLAQRFGVGDAARGSGPAVDRARAAVTWRIRAAIRRIASVHPELARHLPNAVRTGTWCSYRPDAPVAWLVEGASAD